MRRGRAAPRDPRCHRGRTQGATAWVYEPGDGPHWDRPRDCPARGHGRSGHLPVPRWEHLGAVFIFSRQTPESLASRSRKLSEHAKELRWGGLCLSPLCHRLETKLGFSVSRGEQGSALLCVAAVFQTDEQMNSEPKVKKLEPVLLPGKRSRPSGHLRVRVHLAPGRAPCG